MVVIYAYGCLTCGKIGKLIRRASRYFQEQGIELEVRNTRYNDEYLKEQIAYLKKADLTLGLYPAIIVEEGKVSRLSEWNFS